MKKQVRLPIVAVDDGYAQIKLWGDGEGEPVRGITRSSARPGRHALLSMSGEGSVNAYQSEEGEEFTVSADIDSESTQFDGFHTSTMNRILIHHTLLTNGYGGKQITLWTGLPVNVFFNNGSKDVQKIEDKRANLLKKVISESGGSLADIVEVQVGCQAIAAFYDYALADDFTERDVPIEKVAVVDIGGRTTDIAMILDGSKLDPSGCGTINVGVLDVYNAVQELLRAEFKTRDPYPLAILDATVRTGKIKLWGKQREVAHLVTKAVQEQQTKIARELERKLGSASTLDTVLFAGGGSALFQGIGSAFPNAEPLENPEFANARGLWKYAHMVEQSKE